MMKGEEKKVDKSIANASKLGEKECPYCKKSNHKKKSVFGTPINRKTN
jgi:hypothetical protein